ncbi:MAG: sporulation protein YtfJ [Clostridiales bacterium]|jgi:sporulation protein YtfJ|nr:sporulation protein YtfJ [Clostridiales bacterium]
MDSNINDIMSQAMENLKSMIDVDTVVGKPIRAGDGYVVPVSRVTFGFIAGGSEFNDGANGNSFRSRANYPHAGGSGSVVSINPLGFLIVGGDDRHSLIKMTDEEDKWSKAAKTLFSTVFGKKDKDNKDKN